MKSMKIVQFLKLPPLLSIYVHTSSTPLILDVQFQTNPPPPILSPKDNPSVKRKHNNIIQGWLLYITMSFL